MEKMINQYPEVLNIPTRVPFVDLNSPALATLNSNDIRANIEYHIEFLRSYFNIVRQIQLLFNLNKQGIEDRSLKDTKLCKYRFLTDLTHYHITVLTRKGNLILCEYKDDEMIEEWPGNKMTKEKLIRQNTLIKKMREGCAINTPELQELYNKITRKVRYTSVVLRLDCLEVRLLSSHQQTRPLKALNYIFSRLSNDFSISQNREIPSHGRAIDIIDSAIEHMRHSLYSVDSSFLKRQDRLSKKTSIEEPQ